MSGRTRIKRKIRAKISGTAERPRLSIYRSNAFIYAQIIDDSTGATIVSASDMKLGKGTKRERAAVVGAELGKLAAGKKITKVVFDRNGFQYTGRIKVLADAAREAGLQF